MAEVTKNQWDELFHKVDEVMKLTEETHKNLDSKIENKVNAKLLKHLGQKYQWLIAFFAGFSVFLLITFFFLNNMLKPLQVDIKDIKETIVMQQTSLNKILMQNKGLFSEPTTSMQYKIPDQSPTKSQKAEPTKDTKSREKASL